MIFNSLNYGIIALLYYIKLFEIHLSFIDIYKHFLSKKPMKLLLLLMHFATTNIASFGYNCSAAEQNFPCLFYFLLTVVLFP